MSETGFFNFLEAPFQAFLFTYKHGKFSLSDKSIVEKYFSRSEIQR